ncbi:MAG: DUF192 domain-containing protein [Pseudomonadales bacterium]|nr:DUF192 domain-containing protein [Pseudomonadales bacterium]
MSDSSARVPGDGDQIVVITPSGAPLYLEVARSDTKRALGLMQRAEVPEGTGMLFLFEEDAPHSIWMWNCLVPLDLVWLDADGFITHLHENAPPCPERPCESYVPPSPARYVIEVGAGRAAASGLVPGARVMLEAVLKGEQR